MIGRNTIIFSVITIVLVAMLAFFIIRETPNQLKTLRQTIGCADETISDSVLDLDSRTTLIGAFISFDKAPDADLRQKMVQLDINLDENSWIFDDSVLAQIPTRSLCQLGKTDGIRLIFIPEN